MDNYFSLEKPVSWKEIAKQINTREQDRPFAEIAETEAFADSHGQLALDIYQTASDLIVEAPIAGVAPEDLQISIHGDILTIKGMRKRCQAVSADDLIYQECHWGDFSRSIILPVDVVSERIDATLKNGILTIRLPKALPNRTIEVKMEA
jgi:HSP20 family protein